MLFDCCTDWNTLSYSPSKANIGHCCGEWLRFGGSSNTDALVLSACGTWNFLKAQPIRTVLKLELLFLRLFGHTADVSPFNLHSLTVLVNIKQDPSHHPISLPSMPCLSSA